MSMKLRLSLIFGFFTLSVCVLTLVGYYGSSELAGSLSHVATIQMPALKYAGEIDMMHDGLRAVVLDGYHSAAIENPTGVLEYQQELSEMAGTAFRAFDAVEKMDLPKDTLAALKEVRPAFEQYVKNGKKVLQFLVENKKGQIEDVLTEFKDQFEVLEKLLAQFISLIERDAKAINMDGTDTPFFILNISLGALVLGLLTAIGSVYTLSTYLQRAYREINSVSKGVSSAGSELSSASHQLAAASQEQASSTEETSSSLEEISGMVASSLKSSEQSVSLSSKVFEMVRSGTDSMSELQKAVNEIAEANDRVDRLAKLIEEIGEKTELIDEIVFQTRLLSFNASVEAERAGEHGRGFAVVAQEVGNLAQMSGKSASEITQIVKKSIKEAHEVVQVNKNKVELGVTLCKKTYQQLQSIEGLSNEISGNAENILRSSEEQNSGVQQINQAIQLISQATQQNTSLAMEVSTNSERLEKEAQKLQMVVGNLEYMVFGRRSRNARNSHATDGASQGSDETEKHYETKGEGPFASSPVGQNVRSFPAKKSLTANGANALKNSDDPWEKL